MKTTNLPETVGFWNGRKSTEGIKMNNDETKIQIIADMALGREKVEFLFCILFTLDLGCLYREHLLYYLAI